MKSMRRGGRPVSRPKGRREDMFKPAKAKGEVKARPKYKHVEGLFLSKESAKEKAKKEEPERITRQQRKAVMQEILGGI